MTSGPPDITRYLDFRAYLRDWFEARKAAEPRYSHRRFAEAAGHSSPSLLSEIISGRRNLTARHQEGFGRALGLRVAEQATFERLISLDQGRRHETRWTAWEALARSSGVRAAWRAEVAAMAYAADPLPSLVATLVQQGTPAEVKALQRALQYEASPGRLQAVLALLAELDGRPAATLPPGLASLARDERTRRTLERVARTADKPSGGGLVGLSAELAVPEELAEMVHSELAAFLAHLEDLCSAGRTGGSRQLYQLSAQLVPVGRTAASGKSGD